MMATAFYDLGMKLNRGAVEGRLANLSQVRSSTLLNLEAESVFRIRICIGSAFDGLLDPDPHCECGSRRGKISPKEEEKCLPVM
jgi:hypothetical protein